MVQLFELLTVLCSRQIYSQQILSKSSQIQIWRNTIHTHHQQACRSYLQTNAMRYELYISKIISVQVGCMQLQIRIIAVFLFYSSTSFLHFTVRRMTKRFSMQALKNITQFCQIQLLKLPTCLQHKNTENWLLQNSLHYADLDSQCEIFH